MVGFVSKKQQKKQNVDFCVDRGGPKNVFGLLAFLWPLAFSKAKTAHKAVITRPRPFHRHPNHPPTCPRSPDVTRTILLFYIDVTYL